MESYPSCPNRLLKRDTQSCDDLCSSADVSNGKLYLAHEFYLILLQTKIDEQNLNKMRVYFNPSLCDLIEPKTGAREIQHYNKDLI